MKIIPRNALLLTLLTLLVVIAGLAYLSRTENHTTNRALQVADLPTPDCWHRTNPVATIESYNTQRVSIYVKALIDQLQRSTNLHSAIEEFPYDAIYIGDTAYVLMVFEQEDCGRQVTSHPHHQSLMYVVDTSTAQHWFIGQLGYPPSQEDVFQINDGWRVLVELTGTPQPAYYHYAVWHINKVGKDWALTYAIEPAQFNGAKPKWRRNGTSTEMTVYVWRPTYSPPCENAPTAKSDHITFVGHSKWIEIQYLWVNNAYHAVEKLIKTKAYTVGRYYWTVGCSALAHMRAMAQTATAAYQEPTVYAPK